MSISSVAGMLDDLAAKRRQLDECEAEVNAKKKQVFDEMNRAAEKKRVLIKQLGTVAETKYLLQLEVTELKREISRKMTDLEAVAEQTFNISQETEAVEAIQKQSAKIIEEKINSLNFQDK